VYHYGPEWKGTGRWKITGMAKIARKLLKSRENNTREKKGTRRQRFWRGLQSSTVLANFRKNAGR